MPPVRRQHEFRNGGREPVVEPVIADHFAGDLRNSQPELLALRGEFAGHSSQRRFSSAEWRLFRHF